MFVDQDSIADAVEEMQDLVADEQRAVRRSRTRLVTLFALATVTAAVTLVSGPLSPEALAAAFLSVGQFGVSEAFAAHEPTQPSSAGLLITARKELGWQ
jgi:ABC-type enterobactin transport system permease subunit